MNSRKKMYYDRKADVLYLLVKAGEEEEVVEVSPGVNVELDKKGNLIGIEILNAGRSLGKVINGGFEHQNQRFASV